MRAEHQIHTSSSISLGMSWCVFYVILGHSALCLLKVEHLDARVNLRSRWLLCTPNGVYYVMVMMMIRDEVGTITYHGIRSELENEELFIKLWDWDNGPYDDLIGEARIPLRGILDYGTLCWLFK